MISSDVRFCREEAERYRAYARLTEQFRRQLIAMAAEYDRARRAEESLQSSPTESASAPPDESAERLTLSIKDAARLLGLGRSTIYRLIGDRELETVKIRNGTLIKTASVRKLIEFQD